MCKNIALVVAGGNGSRMSNQSTPKQFIEVLGKPIIAYTLECFEKVEDIDLMVVVCASEYKNHVREIINKYAITKAKVVVEGGKTRQQSVFNGLKELANFAQTNAVVLIHDAARPILSEKIILDNILTSREFGAACTCIPCVDTIFRVDTEQNIKQTVNRDEFYLAQTPQSFIFEEILYAHSQAFVEGNNLFSDDAGVYLRYNNKPLKVVGGNKLNFKITVDEDLKLFKNIIIKKLLI